MKKQDALIRFAVCMPVKFLDQEDLDQQIEDLRVELESLGFEIEGVKCKQDDEDDELVDYEEEQDNDDV